MRLAGSDHAWAIGDCARIVNAHDQELCPPTRQFAERRGRQVADNIVRAIRGDVTRPFTYKTIGVFCAISGRNAVAEILGRRISGFFAWFLWRSVNLFKLLSWSRRVKVGADWAWDLLFARDLVNLKADPTERVPRAYSAPATSSSARASPRSISIRLRKARSTSSGPTKADGSEQLVAVIWPGDFFGEMALIEGRRAARVCVRALWWK